jgi:hypothetical protein
MKKYLAGMIAVIIAVTLTAFTTNQNGDEKKFDTLYYWYTDGSALGTYIGDFTSHSAAVGGSTCNDLGGNVCARGFTQAQLVNQTIGNPPAALGTYTDQIVKNN